MIGSSNNPVSGLTLSTLFIAALLMVSLGVGGPGGVAIVLGGSGGRLRFGGRRRRVAAGFQGRLYSGRHAADDSDGRTAFGVVSSLVMFFPLMLLHQANIKQGGIGFGDPKLPAPQAGLMALIAKGLSAATWLGR